MTGNGEAAEALALVREARRAAAARAKAPFWYHAGMGVVVGILVAAMESDNGQPFSAVALCLLVVLVTQYQKRTGVWLNAYKAGGPRPRRIILLGTFAIAAAIGFAVWLKFHQGLDGAMIVAGLVTGAFTIWLGLAWERAFLSDAGV